MANGNAALHALVEPPSAPAHAPTAIELEIGQAAAAAVVAIAAGLIDWQAEGVLFPSTKIWAGGVLGRIAELQLAHLGDPQDVFSAIVHREGKRALQARPDGVWLAHLGQPGQVDAVLDALLDHVIGIAEKVVRDELAFRAN